MQAVMAASGQDAPSTQHASPGVWAGGYTGYEELGWCCHPAQITFCGSMARLRVITHVERNRVL